MPVPNTDGQKIADELKSTFNFQQPRQQISDWYGQAKAKVQQAEDKIKSLMPSTPAPKAEPAKPTAKPGSFKKGGVVKKTGVALVHKGEKVLTVAQQKAAKKKGK